jgi:DNA-binding CsgD family transcriptional regulator
VATVVNDAHLLSRGREVDLSRLNDAECRVLRLLAEGHTAKSIATELGTTPAAVNERLREARRKTGVGSSRELARLFKAQENRHEQIGVGRGRPAEAALSQPDAEPWRPRTGVFAMIALSVVAAAAAATLMSQAPATTNDIDPLIGEALPKFTDPSELHGKVRAEQRDAEWAPRMENAIRARLMSMPLIGKDDNVLRVTCASTLCEIGGTLIAPPSKVEREDQNSQFNRTIKDLQVPPLTDDLARLGLKVEAGTFTGGKGKPDRTVFLLYYSRAAK